jgi:excisionase family DNA binding protein
MATNYPPPGPEPEQAPDPRRLAHRAPDTIARHADRPAPPPLAYRINDACQVLGVGRTSLYTLVKEGRLKAIRVAGRTLIDAESARTLVASAPTRGAE